MATARSPKLPTTPSAIVINVHLYEPDLDALDALVADQRGRSACAPSRSSLTRIALRLLGELKPQQITDLLNATKT